MTLPRLVTVSHALLLFIAAAIPGHAILGIPLAPIFLGFFGLSAGLYVIAARPRVSVALGLALLGFLVAMGFWFGIALGNPRTALHSAVNEFDSFLLAGLTVFGTFFVLQQGLSNLRIVFGAGLAGLMVFGVIKLAAVLAIFTGLMDWTTLLDSFGRWMDVDPVNAPIVAGIYRFTFGNDTTIPFLIPFLLFHRRLGLRLNPVLRWLAVVVAALLVLLSFSRYLWVLSIVGVLVGAVCFRSPWLILGMALVALAVVAANPSAVMTWYELRFAAASVQESDNVRLDQLAVLPREIAQQPILGKGFGGSARSLVRDEEHPYSYEVQWLAYLMNFGVVGVGIMLAYFAGIARYLLRAPGWGLSMFLLLLFLGLLGGAFTNPYLMCPPFAYTVSLFAAARVPHGHASKPSANLWSMRQVGSRIASIAPDSYRSGQL